jgi:PHD/YefM family antitoxin component YafN of YafNO toxin-antitoxin module
MAKNLFPPGKSANPAGRPKGIPDKLNRLQATAVANSGCTPLEFSIAVMRKDVDLLRAWRVPLKDVTLRVRQHAAEAAMPYVHKKQPVAVEIEGSNSVVFMSAETLMRLPNDELERLYATLATLAALESGADDSPRRDTGDVMDVEARAVIERMAGT